MRRRFAVKLSSALLAVALAFGCCTFLAGWSAKNTNFSKQVMEDLAVSTSLSENGDMKVQETWKVNLKNRGKVYRNLYRTISLDQEKADGVSGFSVYDNDRKKQYSFAGDLDPEQITGDEAQDQCYLHTAGGKTEIGWFMPALSEGVRTFTISYTVKNVVHVYSDTAELYYQFLNGFAMPVTNFHGSVTFPSGGDLNDVSVWLHTDVSDSKVVRNSPSRVSFMAQSVPADTMVELRLLMPVKLFPDSTRKTSESVLSSIKQQEMEEAQKDQNSKDQRYFLGWVDAIGGVLILGISVFLLIYVKRKNKRIRVEMPEYTRDIPPGNSPAGISNLFYFYDGIGEKEKKRNFSATFLSLAWKGYVRFDKNSSGTLTVVMTGDSKKKELTPSERIFFEMISTVSEESGNSFTMAQFKKYAEKHFRYINRQVEDFCNTSKQEIANRGYYRYRPAYLGVLNAVGILMIIGAVVLFASSGQFGSLLVYLPAALLVGGILFLVAGSTKMKLSEKGERDYSVWQGLEKYMLEFSRMKEYGVPELALWEEYLVYATMMGISGRVCKQLKIVYPELSDSGFWDANPSFMYMPLMFGPRAGFGVPGGGFDFGAALGNTLGDIADAATRLANPSPSSKDGFGGGGFGGGGFSGGGGGFGGGGGGVR